MIEVARPAALLLLVLLVPVGLAWRHSRQALPALRARLSLATRVLMIQLLVLALADLRWTVPADRLAVVFVVDRSRSVDEDARDWQVDWIQRARVAMAPRDGYGIVVFGGDAAVERSPEAPPDRAGSLRLASVVDPEATDLAGALRLAQASFPAEASRRIVVLSDGRATRGDALTEARLAAAQGTEVWTATVPASARPEVLVQAVEVPRNAPREEPFDVRITVAAERPGGALLTLTRNDREVARREVTLEAGLNVFLVPQRLREGGAWRYEARSEAPGDRHPGNNRAGAVTLVRGRPRLLFVTGEGETPGPLPARLRERGLEVRVVGAGALPRSPAEYGGYGAVVFSDVSALAVPESQAQALRSLVVEAGLGFAMLGGPSSFGSGGWFRTPVEEVLPVEMDIRKSRRGAVLALALVLDKSGSMAEPEGPVTRLALAREAALAAAKLLSPEDSLGAVAFDSASRWVVPMRRWKEAGQAAAELATLEPGGGTDLYPALDAALGALEQADAPLKHAIVLSDGRTEPGDFDALARRAAKGRITLTTVAVGSDADFNFLRDLAAKTGGRSYLANQATLLPRIFTRETLLAARAAFSEKPFRAGPGASHPVLRGLELERAPLLGGYNLSTLRPPPSLGLLRTPEGDPLLAVGRAGLGRTAAWTSDAGQRWAASWLEDPGSGELLPQLLRWIAAGGRDPGFDVRVEEGASGGPRVVVEARDLDAPLDLQGRSLGPDGASRPLDLVQTGPGRYEAPLEAPTPGSWLVQVVEPEGGSAASATWTLPYSPELARLGPDPAFMARLAAAGGGKNDPPAAGVFAPPSHPIRVARPVWAGLLALALLLLPLDVALRRVFLPEGWLRRVLARREPPAPAPGDPTLRALLHRKREARSDLPAPSRPERAERADAPLRVPPPPATDAAPPSEAGTLERLRRARERSRQDRD